MPSPAVVAIRAPISFLYGVIHQRKENVWKSLGEGLPPSHPFPYSVAFLQRPVAIFAAFAYTPRP